MYKNDCQHIFLLNQKPIESFKERLNHCEPSKFKSPKFSKKHIFQSNSFSIGSEMVNNSVTQGSMSLNLDEPSKLKSLKFS